MWERPGTSRVRPVQLLLPVSVNKYTETYKQLRKHCCMSRFYSRHWAPAGLSVSAEYQLLCGNQAPGFIIDIHTGKPIGKGMTMSKLALWHTKAALVQSPLCIITLCGVALCRYWWVQGDPRYLCQRSVYQPDWELPLWMSDGLQLQQHTAHLWRYNSGHTWRFRPSRSFLFVFL